MVGVGTRAAASQRLVSVCSSYKFWGTIVAEVEPDAQPAVTASFDLVDAENLLVQAFQQLPGDNPAASTVKSKMLALDPAFDERNYGCRTFRDFLTRLPNRKVTTVGKSGDDITLHLEPAESAMPPEHSR